MAFWTLTLKKSKLKASVVQKINNIEVIYIIYWNFVAHVLTLTIKTCPYLSDFHLAKIMN